MPVFKMNYRKKIFFSLFLLIIIAAAFFNKKVLFVRALDCSATQCFWGDNNTYFTDQCVNSGSIRENSWARLICRNGQWKTAENGWGCNIYACDTGSPVYASDQCFCRSCVVNPGVAAGCSPGQCYWGPGSATTLTAECVNSGVVRENVWGRVVCRNGQWKISLNGWGCNSSLGYPCDQGACQNIGNVGYCANSFPLPASASTGLSSTNLGLTCQSSCTPNCTGKTCGSDGCGGSCGVCASGSVCNASGQCATNCTPNCTGKTCGSDGCGGSCGICALGYVCNGNGVCVAGSGNCVSNQSKKCDSGNLYWYDSCGNRGDLAQKCGNNTLTTNYRCEGAWAQQGMISRDCVSNACTETQTWSNVKNCALVNQTCKNGICATSDVAAPIIFGLSPLGTVYSPDITLAVSTNEAADCRYGSKDAVFGAMISHFTTSNRTKHTALVKISGTGNHTYFVRCQDAAGNASAISSKIIFKYVLNQPANGIGGPGNEAPADKFAPIISNPSPDGEVAEEKVKISVVTGEKAICKYDIDDIEYGKMKEALGSDDSGTYHSKELTLSVAGSYAYNIKCKDLAGNITSKPVVIKFDYLPAGQPGPKISEAAPLGAVYQSKIALAVRTSVRSVCRYSDKDEDFTAMMGIFTADEDGLRQMAAVDLENYGEYHYFVRCQDEKGNTKGSFSEIKFNYKDPNEMPVENQIVPKIPVCQETVLGNSDGQCDELVDCVCDPDCAGTEGSSDPDCVAIKNEPPKINFAPIILISLMAVVLAIAGVVAIIMRRKESQSDDEEIND